MSDPDNPVEPKPTVDDIKEAAEDELVDEYGQDDMQPAEDDQEDGNTGDSVSSVVGSQDDAPYPVDAYDTEEVQESSDQPVAYGEPAGPSMASVKVISTLESMFEEFVVRSYVNVSFVSNECPSTR